MKKHFKHHKISTFFLTKLPFYFYFDAFLIFISLLALITDFFGIYSGYFETIILLVVSLLGLLPVVISAARALIKLRLTIDLLASIALFFALWNKELKSAVFIALMLASARLFSYFTENKTKNAIRKLLKLRPEDVHVKTDKGVVHKNIKEIKIGDSVVIDSGERIAVDGVVISGMASIDQASLTGESEPISKKVGDEVFSSTLNISGSLVVKVTKIGEDTTFSKIVKLIEAAQQGKSPISMIMDKFTSAYIFLTLIGSIAVYFISNSLSLVLSILLVTCADDLAVAIPIAFMAAISVAAKNGIIIKGASYLEGFNKVKAMVFDKTGTITMGKPKVENMVCFSNDSEEKLLSLLGGTTSESNHPVSDAIYKFVIAQKIKPSEITDIYEEPGKGMKGKIGNENIFVGSENFLKEKGIKFSEGEMNLINKERIIGRSVVVAAVGEKPLCFVSLSDEVHPEVRNIFEKLKNLGVRKLFMLTGDNERVANQVAEKVGISEFKANLLPGDKVDFIKNILNKNYKTAMIGDGINDAAALAAADIGVAMGAVGSDVAIETADIALMKDKLSNLLDLMKLSGDTMKIIFQNIIFWGVINIIGLVLVFLGVIGPKGAAAYNFITDFVPLFNSLRIFRWRF